MVGWAGSVWCMWDGGVVKVEEGDGVVGDGTGEGSGGGFGGNTGLVAAYGLH
jgi:hypothetical protein